MRGEHKPHHELFSTSPLGVEFREIREHDQRVKLRIMEPRRSAHSHPRLRATRIFSLERDDGEKLTNLGGYSYEDRGINSQERLTQIEPSQR